MVCSDKHQQQSCHNENTKRCMFINYMDVNILFSLRKDIPIMFEPVTHITKLSKILISHNATRYHTFAFVQWAIAMDYHTLRSYL